MDEILERLSAAEKQLLLVKKKHNQRDLQKMISNIDKVITTKQIIAMMPNIHDDILKTYVLNFQKPKGSSFTIHVYLVLRNRPII